MEKRETAEKLAMLIKERGGRAYYVGGCVRDMLRGKESTDLDIEVYGLSADELLKLFEPFGKVGREGISDGIFTLEDRGIDVALPRREKCVGSGHRDIEVEVAPGLDVKEAAQRRDFTVNAILCDVLSGEIEDPYNGADDIKSKTLRCVDGSSFGDDPLRLLRGCQFSARFGYSFDAETEKICKGMDISTLSKERAEGEMRKALLSSDTPSVFFENLRRLGKLSYWFCELEKLIGLEQDAERHPEGDVWNHTMEVVDRAAKKREQSEDAYKFMMFALTHDFGKITATEMINGRIHAYGHENAGVAIAEDFVERISGNRELSKYLKNMIPLHMKANIIAENRSPIKTSNRLFDSAVSPEDLILFAAVDKVTGREEETERFLRGRYDVFKERMSKPYVTGKELLDQGIVSGEEIGELLEFAHKLRLAGVDRESALKQTLARAKKGKKSEYNKIF